MKQSSVDNKKLLKELQAQLKILQAELVKAQQKEGKDAFIDVRVQKNQARFEKIKKRGEDDKAVGKFYIEMDITAKQGDVFIPLSVASGKKSGWIYVPDRGDSFRYHCHRRGSGSW